MSAVFEAGGKLVLRGGSIMASTSGPAPPTSLWAGYVDSYTTTVAWWPSTDGTAATYNVYRGATQIATGITGQSLQGGGGTLQYYIVDNGGGSNLANSTAYTYTVTAVNSSSVEGAHSGSITMTTLAGTSTAATAPTAPTAWSPPTYSTRTGNTWTATVTSGEGGPGSGTAGTGTGNRTNCGLQYALDNCAYGDLIVLTAGSTYQSGGSYGYVAGAGSGYGSTSNGQIYIQTSNYTGLTGAGRTPGVRALKTDTSYMPTIQCSQSANGYGITFAGSNTAGNSARYWRMVGINVAPAASDTSTFLYYLINVCGPGGYNPGYPGQYYNPTVGDYITIDRCVVGNDSANFGSTFSYVSTGISVNANHFDLDSSYVYGFYNGTYEAHGVQVFGGQYLTLNNNYLEAAGEGVLVGGVYIAQNAIPQDIVYSNNTNAKLAAWESNAIGSHVKNHFELKVGQRVACFNNIHTLSWYGSASVGQNGRSFVLGARDQQAGGGATATQCCPWNNVTDVDIYNNQILQVNQGIFIFTADYSATAYTSRVRVKNNIIWVNPPAQGTYVLGWNGYCMDITSNCADIIVDHNTMILSNANVVQPSYTVALYLDTNHTNPGWSNYIDRPTFTNNVLDTPSAIGTYATFGNGGITGYLQNYQSGSITANVMLNDSSTYTTGAGGTYSNHYSSGYSGAGFSGSGSGMPTSGPTSGAWIITSGSYATGSTTGAAIGETFY